MAKYMRNKFKENGQNSGSIFFMKKIVCFVDNCVGVFYQINYERDEQFQNDF